MSTDPTFAAGASVFLGPRTLRADGNHSEQMPVSHGMVAGSSQANHLARALLHRAPHDHHHQCPKLAVSQCVDDLKMHTEGTRAFPFSWQAQSRSVASTCGFVATTRGTALTVCSGWQEKGFGNSSTRHARDLGVDVSFGCRSVPIARKGESKAHSGFHRKHARASRLLFKGGALPQSTYGHQIRSISTHIHCNVCGLRQRGPRGDIVLECVPPLCLPSQKQSQHLVCTRKSSPSILCFCATTLCKPRELNVPGSCCSDVLREEQENVHGFKSWVSSSVIAILLKLEWNQ